MVLIDGWHLLVLILLPFALALYLNKLYNWIHIIYTMSIEFICSILL
jgi:hypothetical protein